MSCFLVPKAHVAVILHWYRHHQRGSWPVTFYHNGQRQDFGDSMSRETWEAVGAILWNANRASVAECYSEPMGDDTFTVKDLAVLHGSPRAVVILKALACLEYQSCDWTGWEESLPNRIVRRIRGAAINALPGYDDAPWDIDDPKDPRLYAMGAKVPA